MKLPQEGKLYVGILYIAGIVCDKGFGSKKSKSLQAQVFFL
jgi:hypothetical protein